MIEFFMFLWNHMTEWFLISILVMFIWGLCLGDPDSNEKVDFVITVIISILCLPVTLFILLLGFVFAFVLRKRLKKDE